MMAVNDMELFEKKWAGVAFHVSQTAILTDMSKKEVYALLHQDLGRFLGHEKQVQHGSGDFLDHAASPVYRNGIVSMGSGRHREGRAKRQGDGLHSDSHQEG